MEKYNNWKLKFYTIWAGQAVSLITSAILQMAIIFYLTEKTGSAMVLSMASLVGFLPYAVFGPAIGVLVDRHDRKKIMIGADLIIAAAGAVLAIVALYMELPIWMVMVVLFIRSIGTAFHTPALNAVTPLLVPEEQLTKCAGYSQSLQSISYIVSPAVAALLYSVWELNAIIAIDVLGAVIASITVAIVRIPKLGDQVQSLKPNFIREMKEGMAVLRQNKGLFALLLVGTLYMFVYMPINALYPLITMEYFNGTPMHISITEIAYASGMLIGGLLLGLFGNYQKRILLITASIFMMDFLQIRVVRDVTFICRTGKRRHRRRIVCAFLPGCQRTDFAVLDAESRTDVRHLITLPVPEGIGETHEQRVQPAVVVVRTVVAHAVGGEPPEPVRVFGGIVPDGVLGVQRDDAERQGERDDDVSFHDSTVYLLM